MRGLNLFRVLDYRHKDGRILRQTNLRSFFPMGPNRLHRHPMPQHRVMTNLIHLRIRQFHARRKLAVLVTQVGEADEFVGGKKMADLIGKVFRNISRVIAERLRGVAGLPTPRQSLRQVPVKQRDVWSDIVLE